MKMSSHLEVANSTFATTGSKKKIEVMYAMFDVIIS